MLLYLRFPGTIPAVSGLAWFITLSTLLIYWLAVGRPRYPGQSNPYVAFISNIGSGHLRPLFIGGSLLTSFSFVATIAAVHVDRHNLWSPLPTRVDIQPLSLPKLTSILAILFAIAAGLSLSLLSIFDTLVHHSRHQKLLLSCFLSLAGSALCTAGVCRGYLRKSTKPSRRRRCYIASNVIISMELVLSIAMTVAESSKWFRLAGILEWTLGFVGVGYIWAFIGFFGSPDGGDGEVDENRPLIRGEGRR